MTDEPTREQSERVFTEWLNSPGCPDDPCTHPEHQLEARLAAGTASPRLVASFMEAQAAGAGPDELLAILNATATEWLDANVDYGDPADPAGDGR